MTPLRFQTVMLLASILLLTSAVTQAGWRSEGPYCGQITGVAIDPAHPETIYIATSYAGVWRSDDRGVSWTLPGDELTSRKVSWVKVDRTNSSTIWAGVEKSGQHPAWNAGPWQ